MVYMMAVYLVCLVSATSKYPWNLDTSVGTSTLPRMPVEHSWYAPEHLASIFPPSENGGGTRRKDFLEAIADMQLLDVGDHYKYNSLEPWRDETDRTANRPATRALLTELNAATTTERA